VVRRAGVLVLPFRRLKKKTPFPIIAHIGVYEEDINILVAPFFFVLEFGNLTFALTLQLEGANGEARCFLRVMLAVIGVRAALGQGV
jgi:hypothetical protein